MVGEGCYAERFRVAQRNAKCLDVRVAMFVSGALTILKYILLFQCLISLLNAWIQAFGRVFYFCGDGGDELAGGGNHDGTRRRRFSFKYLQVLKLLFVFDCV